MYQIDVDVAGTDVHKLTKPQKPSAKLKQPLCTLHFALKQQWNGPKADKDLPYTHAAPLTKQSCLQPHMLSYMCALPSHAPGNLWFRILLRKPFCPCCFKVPLAFRQDLQ